jgi:RNA polymerase-binding transcription factor DksA
MEVLMSKRRLLPRPPRFKRCKFALDAPAAGSVAVTGSFCGWESGLYPLVRGKDGVWRTTVLVAPGRHEYRFLVDGLWQDDPARAERVPNPFGTENCVLRVEVAPDNRSESYEQRHRPMTKKQIDGYQKKLVALFGTLDRELAHDRRELMRVDEPDVPGGPMPSTENMVNSGAEEVETGVIASEERLLAEVSAALRRIDAGTFGRCEACGKQIARTRLDALPYARQCIRCARVTQPTGG